MKRNDKPITGGHALWAVERFADSTRHMIIYDQPVYDTPVGVEDKRLRRFVSDAEYAEALKAEERGDIKIIVHATVIEGHILPDRKKAHHKGGRS
jgi:hypothetical protein